ncbi:conserved hypothetical protein [Bosea sp. 62]|uniref:hypothetical protein n=1 Tax=unclassified Bosea (in: a-proteobacteria) TaxID=2653178 RepID=UPI00125613FE|nr:MULTISPECIES: hypothetical protein [unclassified Bosea (in: a-proteobacteria)]CAD5291555.1 conserved hypothetical protein [Bosea sp. 7B]CAD5299620.1 conserved hypothetical protein [Bosea sp. 21B]CAD5299736.1 conserved hypothetical protein [Bosea sp. 46]VVT61725.1 conserved hypothetical protein [Bosea sp. EC-HK365B]VXB04457.1 conserved hypothetical protein [Bosea sp. 127]
MLLDRRTLQGIAEGNITQVLRRWRRPSVKSGGTLLTAIGQLAIDAVQRITEDQLDAADARAAGFETREAALAALTGREGSLYRIRICLAGPDPREALRFAGELTEVETSELIARLGRFDARRRWTHVTLRVIATHPGRRALELAALLGRDVLPFKQDVRKLKALGLTESLDVGYRLSPRGEALLSRLGPGS